MMRSLYSAISGLKAHQTKMDVIGNNIANVNTPGFKRSTVTFATALSQTIQGASTPTASTTGGTNPIQVGLGTSIGAINQVMTQGSNQTTGNPTDMMIQGSGFFALKTNAGDTVYTRSGSFTFDGSGNLVDPATGAMVLDTSGTPINIDLNANTYSIDSTGAITVIPKDGTTPSSVLSNGIGIVQFTNDAGLQSIGNGYYTATNNTGTATTYGVGGSSAYPSKTSLVTGALEMSNVDLSQEMTDMITAQRGFQANSRVITVSDTLLQELIDLKRS
ncbi:flagellar hook-basal body complex protein [Desulfosporosinus sp. FKA]|uniref:flagellar hook-basal body complex protein n=1 Tax=Desulfosporosinus sp. FKA TaxID=1969834 RepID=UPI000B49EF6E|nr:flagellar hook-basal body complex protein [Desulfosporosinus sp. FKA]